MTTNHSKHKEIVQQLQSFVLVQLLRPNGQYLDQTLPGMICNLAAAYQRGYNNCLDPNPVQAFLLYERAAQLGHSLAMQRAAKMLMQGNNVLKDPVHSLYLLMHAKDRFSGKDRSLIDFRIMLLLQVPQIVEKLHSRKLQAQVERNFEIVALFSRVPKSLRYEDSEQQRSETIFSRITYHPLYEKHIVLEIMSYCGDTCLPLNSEKQVNVSDSVKYIIDQRLVPKRRLAIEVLSDVATSIEKCSDDGIFFRFMILMCLFLTFAIIFSSRNLWLNKSFSDWLVEGSYPY